MPSSGLRHATAFSVRAFVRQNGLRQTAMGSVRSQYGLHRLWIPADVGTALAEFPAVRGPTTRGSVFLTLRAPIRPIRADLVGDVVSAPSMVVPGIE